MSEQHGSTERKLYDLLSHALAWLDNLEQQIGNVALVDASPNNWGGRVAIREALVEVEEKHPEWADFPPGTMVHTGVVYGYVERRGTLNLGRRAIPAYLVDIGRETVPIPVEQVTRVPW